MAVVNLMSVELETPHPAFGDAVVVAMSGTERVSRPYRFRIDVAVPRVIASETCAQLLGARLALVLRFGAAESERRIHGLVTAAEHEGRSTGDRDVVRLTLRPAFALLRHTKRSTLHQGLSAVDVVRNVLLGHGLEVRLSLKGEYAVRDLCIQYMESDLEFVHRLLSEEAVFYFFEPTEDGSKERIVLCDHAPGVESISGPAEVHFRASSGMLDASEDILTVRCGTSVAANQVMLKEFDFERPSFEVKATASDAVSHSPLEIYEHHGQHGGLDVHADAATRRLEQARRTAALALGTSRCARFSSGRRFSLTGAPSAHDDGEYTLLRVSHRARLPQHDATSDVAYENDFVAVRSNSAPRPKAIARRVHESLLTATVVGPAGQEIHTDEHGRIRVQFHWDREGKRNEFSCAWIRVAQTWAGVGWGFQFIPRIGMEVLVAFVGGDLDRPLVVSAVPNAEHPLPFPLPVTKTKSGIRTQSSRGGGGFHELSFEDRAGYERIYLRSQMDLEEEVLNDHVSQVARDRVAKIGASQVTQIAKDNTVLVGGSLTASVGGDDVATVAGQVRRTVDGSSTSTVAGDLTEDVHGNQERVTRGASLRVVHATDKRVVGSEESTVQGARRMSIGGGNIDSIGGNQQVTVGGSVFASAGDGLFATIGRGDEQTRFEIDKGRAAVTTSDELVLEANQRIRILVGDSEVIIDKSGITFHASKLSSQGDRIELISKGASLALEQDLRAKAAEVQLTSQGGSSLVLDAAARLKGPQIALGGSATADKLLADQRRQEEPIVPRAKITLFDLAGSECAGHHYEVAVPGWTKRGTAANGVVEIPMFEGVESCSLRWGRPLGDRADWETTAEFEHAAEVFLVTEVEDAEESLRRKLSNLGHGRADLNASVAAFQAHKGAEAVDRASVIASIDEHHRDKVPARKRRNATS